MQDHYNNCPFKKWVKPIDITTELDFSTFVLSNKFKHVASVTHDKVLNVKGKKQRNTVIQFVPTNTEEWSKKVEWIYIFTIDNKIVKIGGTRTGLKGRAGSYLCGHHIPERARSGHCSNTNAYIYNTFDFFLELGHNIEMYAFEIPQVQVQVDMLGETVAVQAQIYHAYESRFLQEYKKQMGRYPSLSDNADPTYK